MIHCMYELPRQAEQIYSERMHISMSPGVGTGEEWLQGGMKEPFGWLEIVYILIVVVVTYVYAFVKTHQTAQ